MYPYTEHTRKCAPGQAGPGQGGDGFCMMMMHISHVWFEDHCRCICIEIASGKSAVAVTRRQDIRV